MINTVIEDIQKINKKHCKISKALKELECDICCSRLIAKESTFKCGKHSVCKVCYIMMDECPFCRSDKDKTNLRHKNSMFGLVECTPKSMNTLEEASKLYGWEIHINHLTNILRIDNPKTASYVE